MKIKRFNELNESLEFIDELAFSDIEIRPLSDKMPLAQVLPFVDILVSVFAEDKWTGQDSDYMLSFNTDTFKINKYESLKDFKKDVGLSDSDFHDIYTKTSSKFSELKKEILEEIKRVSQDKNIYIDELYVGNM